MSVRKPVKQFRIGKKDEGADFTLEEIENLTMRIALWYRDPASGRTYEDPVAVAKQKVRECLLAETDTGDPWPKCPREFADRVRVKCGYDITEQRGIRSGKKKPIHNGHRDLDAAAQKAAKALSKTNVVANTLDQDAFRVQVEADVYQAFPELDNPASRPTVRSLSGLLSEREKIDLTLQLNTNDAKRHQLLESLKVIELMLDTQMKRLGIHPDQVRKKLSDKAMSSVGDLVALVDGDQEFHRREKIWALQLALQLYWMSEHFNGRKSGPQVSDFEIWHMTRSRPIRHKCKCGYEALLVEGFEPHELQQLLLNEGVLIEEPVVNGLFAPGDLAGLATHDFTQDGSDVHAPEEDTLPTDAGGSSTDPGDPSPADGLR